jgi:hypothetical protein
MKRLKLSSNVPLQVNKVEHSLIWWKFNAEALELNHGIKIYIEQGLNREK